MTIFIIKAVQLILSLTILVIVHEFGHFLMARMLKVRVDKFYIFFNPWFTLFRFKPRNSNTEWGLGWLPLGGYCKIAGMIDESMDTELFARDPQPWEFRSRPAWQRLLIMVGGVVFNLFFAMIVYIVVTFTWGRNELPAEKMTLGMNFSPVAKVVGFRNGDILLKADNKPLDALDRDFVRKIISAATVTIRRDGADTTLHMPSDLMQRILRDGRGFLNINLPFVVDSVLPTGSAAFAGLLPGDKLLTINGKNAKNIDNALTLLHSEKGHTVEASFIRTGDTLTRLIAVNTDGQIGVTMRPINKIYPVRHLSYTPLSAIPAGLSQGTSTLTGYVHDLKYVFTREGAQSLGGFGAIGSLFPAVWDWHSFWLMTALLSIILAVMNILPIPALDGGHILFLLIEAVTGKKFSDKALINAQMVGMAILMLLVLYANGMDVFRFFSK